MLRTSGQVWLCLFLPALGERRGGGHSLKDPEPHCAAPEMHWGIHQRRDVTLRLEDLSGDNEAHPRRCAGGKEAGRGSHLPLSPCDSPGLDDPYQHGRGVALADFNRDGRVDIVYGNWNGPHRLYLQSGAPGRVRFRVRAGSHPH